MRTQPTCPCRVMSTDCLKVRGSGTPDDPYQAYYAISEDAENAVVASPNGLRLLIPPEIGARPAVRAVGTKTVGWDDPPFPVAVPFDGVIYDTGGLWDSSIPDVLTISRTGLWAVGGFIVTDASEGVPSGMLSLQVNDLRRIANEGPRDRATTSPPMSSAISTQYEFEAGDTLKMYWEPSSVAGLEGAHIRQDRWLYATFRGD